MSRDSGVLKELDHMVAANGVTLAIVTDEHTQRLRVRADKLPAVGSL